MYVVKLEIDLELSQEVSVSDEVKFNPNRIFELFLT
jgi:hypothetical protein